MQVSALLKDRSLYGFSSHLTTNHAQHNSGVVFAETGEKWTEYNAVTYNNAVTFGDEKAGHKDVYMGVNAVLPYQRRCVENVNYLTSQFVDVDCYNLGLTQEQALTASLEICKQSGVPEPSRVIDSGRGIYLEWFFSNPVYCGKKAENANSRKIAWTITQESLIELFSSIGADPKCKDASRVLRIVGSVNSKSNTTVSTIFVGDHLESPFTITKILTPKKEKVERIKPTVKPLKQVTRTITRKDGIISLLTPMSLAYSRMDDLRTLAELRGGKLTDHREMAIFYYAMAASVFYGDQRDLIRSVEDYMESAILLNGKYKIKNVSKLLVSLLRRHKETQDNRKGGCYISVNYKARNATIIKSLAITEHEQQFLKTIISKEEKYNRKKLKRAADGVVSREEYRSKAAGKKARAVELKATGLSNKQISDELSVHIKTVQRYLR